MKLTKSQLKQIIKEELTKIFEGTGTGADAYEGDMLTSDPGLGYDAPPFYTDFEYLTLPRGQWPEGSSVPSDVTQAQKQGREIIPAILTTAERKALANPNLQLDPNTGKLIRKMIDPKLKTRDAQKDLQLLKKSRANDPGEMKKTVLRTLSNIIPKEERTPTSFDQFYKELDDFGLGYLMPAETRDKKLGPQHREAFAALKHAKKETAKGAKGQIVPVPLAKSAVKTLGPTTKRN